MSEDSFAEEEFDQDFEEEKIEDNLGSADFNLNQRKQQSQVEISSHQPDFNLRADKRQHSSLYVNTKNSTQDNAYGI